jgi:hypothetical protein
MTDPVTFLLVSPRRSSSTPFLAPARRRFPGQPRARQGPRPTRRRRRDGKPKGTFPPRYQPRAFLGCRRRPLQHPRRWSISQSAIVHGVPGPVAFSPSPFSAKALAGGASGPSPPAQGELRRGAQVDAPLGHDTRGACVAGAETPGAADPVPRTRLPATTSCPNGSPRKATKPCSAPWVVP